jgi:hypothetical protein
MRGTPGLGLFLAVSAGLAALWALVAPLPGRFGDPGGGGAG